MNHKPIANLMHNQTAFYTPVSDSQSSIEVPDIITEE